MNKAMSTYRVQQLSAPAAHPAPLSRRWAGAGPRLFLPPVKSLLGARQGRSHPFIATGQTGLEVPWKFLGFLPGLVQNSEVLHGPALVTRAHWSNAVELSGLRAPITHPWLCPGGNVPREGSAGTHGPAAQPHLPASGGRAGCAPRGACAAAAAALCLLRQTWRNRGL